MCVEVADGSEDMLPVVWVIGIFDIHNHRIIDCLVVMNIGYEVVRLSWDEMAGIEV